MSDIQSLVDKMNGHFAKHDKEFRRDGSSARASNDAGQKIKAELESLGVALTRNRRGFFSIKETP